MARFLPRLTLIDGAVLAAVLVVLALLAQDYVSPRFGERAGLRDAEADLAAGTPRLLIGGRPRSPLELREVTRERLDAEVRFTGCRLTAYSSAYERAYHDRLEAEIRKSRPTFDLEEEIASIHREAYERRARN